VTAVLVVKLVQLPVTAVLVVSSSAPWLSEGFDVASQPEFIILFYNIFKKIRSKGYVIVYYEANFIID